MQLSVDKIDRRRVMASRLLARPVFACSSRLNQALVGPTDRCSSKIALDARADTVFPALRPEDKLDTIRG